MYVLALAALLFVGTHLGISSTPLRAVMVRTFGEGPYLLIYSLIAFATIGTLVFAYINAPRSHWLWMPAPGLLWVPVLIMPFALIMLVGGFMTRNPTTVGQAGQLAKTGAGSGVVRITRHPFQWAVILWSFSHLVANGDLASVIFFGSFGTLSFVGTFLMDRKQAARSGEAWRAFADATSNLPFAAIVGGRNQLVLRELAMPLIVGLLAYALLYAGHGWISGVPLRF